MKLEQPLPSDPDALEILFHKGIDSLQDMPADKRRADQSVYEILKTNPDATIFCSMVEKHANLLSRLQDLNSGEHTVLVPPDESWKPNGELMTRMGGDQDFQEAVLSAHISPHYVTTDTLVRFLNIPTILTPDGANGPQLIRTRRSRTFRINEAATLTTGNIIAKNGIVHYLDRVLTPPHSSLSVLQSFSELSLFNKALLKLELADDFAALGIKGRTIFAPTDAAFRALDDEILEFLFDPKTGYPYLKALIKYHICPNVTVYTNLIWPKNNTGHRVSSKDSIRVCKGQQTQSITTMAIDTARDLPADVSLHIARYNDLIALTLNNSSHVLAQDILADDGVIHVVDAVLLPGMEGIQGTTEPASKRLKIITLPELRQLLMSFVEPE
ncbi:hypothetical protein MY3296_006193 [Beauveria thailandica]